MSTAAGWLVAKEFPKALDSKSAKEVSGLRLGSLCSCDMGLLLDDPSANAEEGA